MRISHTPTGVRGWLKNHRRHLLLFLSVIAAIFVLLVLLSFALIHMKARQFIYDNIAQIPHVQVAVIPGAAITKDGQLSPVLRDRVDMALRIYKDGIAEKILVTGDNSSLAYNEVNPVRLYLLENGIPDNDIFLDHAGFDTYSSMYRAKEIFLADSMVVVTQTFHLPRAVYIARALDITAYGISADNGHYLLRNDARESLANVKALLNLVIHRQPKYLGEAIPLSGAGNL